MDERFDQVLNRSHTLFSVKHCGMSMTKYFVTMSEKGTGKREFMPVGKILLYSVVKTGLSGECLTLKLVNIVFIERVLVGWKAPPQKKLPF